MLLLFNVCVNKCASSVHSNFIRHVQAYPVPASHGLRHRIKQRQDEHPWRKTAQATSAGGRLSVMRKTVIGCSILSASRGKPRARPENARFLEVSDWGRPESSRLHVFLAPASSSPSSDQIDNRLVYGAERHSQRKTGNTTEQKPAPLYQRAS
jgi:hypothetical protein